jgi:hypothetical protein
VLSQNIVPNRNQRLQIIYRYGTQTENLKCFIKTNSFPSTMSVHRYMDRKNDHFQNLLPRDILGNEYLCAGTGYNSDQLGVVIEKYQAQEI